MFSNLGHMTASTGRVRMSPENRREQLLELGTRLLSTRTLDEISIELLAEEAGISRGLLYHYFGNKQDFHVAVVRRAVEDIYAITAPRDIEDPLEQLAVSLGAYVDYVSANYTGYVSLIRAAAGGNEELRSIYQEARQALTGRIFDIAGSEQLAALGIIDSEATRMLVDGWAALVENVVVAWVEDPHGLSRDDLLKRLALALPTVVIG
jgi:AcrR family transcriptional regulator